MIEFLFAIITAICWATADAISKKAINESGLFRSLAYSYLLIVILLFSGALILGEKIYFPAELLPRYLVQVAVGAIAVIALFKALEEGKASIVAPLTKFYVLLVLAISIVFFSEKITVLQIIGSALIVISATILGFKDIKKMKLEAGVLYLIITVFGWAYFYSFLKIFVDALGFYLATVLVETGVAVAVIFYFVLGKKDLKLDFKNSGSIAIRAIALFAGALFYNYSIAQIGIGLTASIVAASPLATAVIAYFILKEKLEVYKYLAIILTVMGLVLIFLS